MGSEKVILSKIAIGAAIVAVVLCLLLYISCCYLFQVGMVAKFQRKPPKKKPDARPLTPEQLRLQEEKQAAETWRQAQPFQTVAIQSRDNLRLVGHYLPCSQAKRTVLLLHGWRGSWERDMCPFGPFLQEQRCNLLFVEQRGHGASQGEYLGFGVLERYDCLAWVHYLQKREPEGQPIYLLGCSQGATTVLMASGFGLPEQVRGIIADCGFLSPEEQIATTLRDWWHLPKQPFLFVADPICRHRAGYSYRDYSTLEAMKTNRTPVLFVHGSEDRFVPVSNTLRNYQACRAEKELLLVKGARHIQSYLLGGDQYRERLRAWFRKYDTGCEEPCVKGKRAR